ncbi:hypothetical protein GW920_00805 [Candidatus Falkowbacteria bacterium]|uniref:Uncharacterized protein n=1 Tax=Candidatus Falkowbacteria bacterium CG10_big_fil_rev_8_21_14_0_10_37_18 TaxID=1974562 RepID=A0A2H0V982_9BACT|nr:hypothetical protein [Candidatus Falkowbacteria bacterium]NCQ12678.1 hypothetical protein [Candidatus Falkowbacteria bacterium]OIO06240.1 MAG: hypothetical protein AUJ26_01295 [Candidatus Falkowbacteria bacterium CG1_02_37_21]PIR95633.1 MAG: hypothetical protein COT93_01215 [Candidatus Falkowbacteria bacterium CG10_big_fil_rev_8_21_14_0_10_37_18]
MVKKQTIKLKKKDLDQAIVRGLSHTAWETKKILSVKERVHNQLKFKKPKHKKDLTLEDI